MRCLFTASLLLGSALSVNAHGYIKEWSADGGAFERAQKTDLKSSAFRAVPANTGWIGSKFITGPAITCGQDITPRQTIAAPSGTVFADASQSAGKHMDVKAGGEVTLVVSGNPGDGWPHPIGHVQAYMGMCSTSKDGCANFDASEAQYFKILGEKDGIQNTLKPAYDGSVDGNKYTVPIPENIADGSYIFRFELIAFGQSSASEGNQDQYYPLCGQVNIAGGSAKKNSFETVKFPGAYEDGNIDQGTLPGPKALASGPASGAPSSGTKGNTSSGSSSSGSSSSSSGSSSSGSSSSGSCKRRKRSVRRNRHGKRLSSSSAHAEFARHVAAKEGL